MIKHKEAPLHAHTFKHTQHNKAQNASIIRCNVEINCKDNIVFVSYKAKSLPKGMSRNNWKIN